MADTGTASGRITFYHRNACEHEGPESIPIRDAVRAIQEWLTDYETRIARAIESGRIFYVHNKIHSVHCPTLKREIAPTTSYYWTEETDDPKLIQQRYAEVTDGTGGGPWSLAGSLVTAKEAAQYALKRCQTCAPDVIPRTVAKRGKQVANLSGTDLGRLLEGHPVQSITHEPGVVIVHTSAGVRRFDIGATVVLDPAPADTPESPMPIV